MTGYLGREEATRETIVDGWLRTGDVAYMDDDGDVFIVDRVKEIIKVNGIKAFIVRSNDSLTETAVHDHIRDKVSAYQRLECGIEFIREIPRNPAGKAYRKDLKARAENARM